MRTKIGVELEGGLQEDMLALDKVHAKTVTANIFGKAK